MKKFWRFLLRKNFPYDASQLQYTVFGLGDSSYEKYMYVARKLNKRFRQLGAVEFYPRGEGDDQHYLGLESMLMPWLHGMWQRLLELLPLPEGVISLSDDKLLSPFYEVVLSETTNETLMNVPIVMPSNFTLARLMANHRISAR